MQKQSQIRMRCPDPDDMVGNNGRRSKLEGVPLHIHEVHFARRIIPSSQEPSYSY
jgi:hypothetical protein